jgi:hypothetical protein
MKKKYAPTPETKDMKVYKFGWFNENEYTVLENGTAEIRRFKERKGNLTIPEEIDGYRVTRIREGAFRKHSALRDVTIPEGVIRIGRPGFSGM